MKKSLSVFIMGFCFIFNLNILIIIYSFIVITNYIAIYDILINLVMILFVFNALYI